MPRALTDQTVLVQVLSLYLLLLAFFVVLTRLAGAETARVNAVSGSLGSTFATTGRPTTSPAPFTALLGNAMADPASMTRIGDLVRTELALATVREIVPGNVMEVTVDAVSLFVGDTTAIDPLRRRFLERLGAVLGDPAPGVRYDVEIAVGTPLDAASDDAAVRLAAGRGAFLGAVLTGANAPPATLASGIEPGAPGRVRMLFHVRPAVEPRPPFARGNSR